MKRKTVNVAHQSAGSLPFSAAVIGSGTFVYTSGHVGFDYENGVTPDGIEAQTMHSLENLKTVLAAAGTSLANVVKVNVYLADINDFKAMNTVYRQYFPEDQPARSTVGAPLARPELLVEIEMVALLPDGDTE